MKRPNHLILLCLIFLAIGCSEQEPEVQKPAESYLTSFDQEPMLQDIIADLSTESGRVADQLSNVNLDRIYKVDKPQQDQTVFSAPATDGTLSNILFANDEGNMFAFKMVMSPSDPDNRKIDATYTGEIHYETLDGRVFAISYLKNGRPAEPEDLGKGRIETCWYVIDVYYTATEEGEVTHVEFDDGYVECDPEPAGEEVVGLGGTDSEGGAGSGGGPDAGLLEEDLCQVGSEMVEGVCIPICPEGYVRNSSGLCEPEPDCNTSKEDIKKAFPSTSDQDATKIAEYINKHAKNFGIDTQEKLRHFLAQAAHESADFSSFSENLNYSAAQLVKTWPSRFSQTDSTKLDPDDYAGKPEKLANYVYNRAYLGNTSEGDGYKYRGRGIFQLTGKDNYQSFTNFYQNEFNSINNFVSNPGLISSDMEVGVISALWFFKGKVLSKIGVNENTSTQKITKLINGGKNGLKARKEKFDKAKANIDCI